MRVLLVDDDIYALERYRVYIQGLDCEVMAIADSRVAEDLLEVHQFDALISDVQMPIISGLDLIRQMYWWQQEIPTLLHSSEPRHSDGHTWTELAKVHEEFNFVTFHLKQHSSDPTYIKDFLEKLEEAIA